MRVSGNTILLTGATSGIGYALLKKFAALDNFVIIIGRDKEKLKSIEEKFSNVKSVWCDLSDGNSVFQLIGICKEKYPEINIIINNAGVQYNYDFGKTAEDIHKISEEILINLTAPMQLCFALIPSLLKKEESAIINVSSGLAISPKKSAPVYCGTKAAIHHATKSIRYQLEGTSVQVFEILPPLVDTPMTAGRGNGKISADELVVDFMKGFIQNKSEIAIGKVKLLSLIHKLSPRLADRILRNS